MLILSRKEDESIIIGDNIEIKVLEIKDGKVRLGIEAPKNVDILRKELYAEVEEENIAAAESTVDIENIKDIFKE